MPNVERLPLATYRRIQQYARGGGLVIAVKSAPSRAPGFEEGAARFGCCGADLSAICSRPARKNAKLVASPSDLGAAIGAVLKPDVAISPATPTVGFIHRKLPDADIYFLANTDNRPHAFDATFRTKRSAVECLGSVHRQSTSAGTSSTLNLASCALRIEGGGLQRSPCTGARSDPRQKNSRPST